MLNKRPLAHTSRHVGAGQSVHTSEVCLLSDWCVHPASPPGVPSDSVSVCCEQVKQSDSDQGSPRRVFVPVRSSAPTPVASAKKVKVNPAHVAEARVRAIEQCKTPEEFVKTIL